MMLDIIDMAKHAIGMGNRSTFTKYGKEYFVAYRNYYSVNLERNSDWDDLVKHGLAIAHDTANGVNYHLTPDGVSWLGKEISVTILDTDEKEQRYKLDEEDIKRIKEIWEYIQVNDIYAWNDEDHFDVQILFSPYDLDTFFPEFTTYSEDDGIPAKISSYGIEVKFTDLLDFKISGEQIWEFRPETEMRENL